VVSSAAEAERRASFDPHQLPVGDDVTDVRSDLESQRDRQPDAVHIGHELVDLVEACVPGDPDEGAERQGGAERD